LKLLLLLLFALLLLAERHMMSCFQNKPNPCGDRNKKICDVTYQIPA
jgi:hypothetical protein